MAYLLKRNRSPGGGCGGSRHHLEASGQELQPHHSNRPAPSARQTAEIVRLPVFVDGVWIGNEFIRIGPGLRASIRRMAAEVRR